ncbi:MAG: hypothetical protein BGO23_07890 [Solirubrobacterales bacterium 67-14]|nr:MAG: hypothetical protein BGO23_07890 [Solirubrobacterales bacterium 67-14]
MDHFVVPGERTEVVAAMSGLFEEADRGGVDRDGVEAKLTGRLLGRQNLRCTVESARLNREPCSGLGDEPQSSWQSTGRTYS